MIPFGEFDLSLSQVNKMASILWNETEESLTWNDLMDNEKEAFIREFILTIPKTLASIGFKVTGK